MQTIQPDDIYLHHGIQAINCVRGLNIAACEVTTQDREKDKTRSAIWGVPLNGDAPTQLTSGTDRDSSPRWSPDGKTLAFLSNRAGGSAQIFTRAMAGDADAHQLSSFDGAAIDFHWSPDGKRMLVIAEVPVDPNARGSAEGRKNGSSGSSETAPQLAWRLPYKVDGEGYKMAREWHLFVLDVETRDSKRITDGPIEVKGAQWSPNGRQVVYTRTREGRLAHRTDLWISRDDGTNARQVTRDLAIVQTAYWSPDGQTIAFSGGTDEGSAHMSVWAMDVDSGNLRMLGNEEIEVADATAMHWSADSRGLYVAVGHHSRQKIARIALDSGDVEWLVDGDRSLAALAITDDTMVFTAEDPGTAIEVHASDFSGRNQRQLTDFNAWWKKRAAPQASLRSFDVPDGKGGTETIEGWLLTPGGNGPFPLLVDAHGGPASHVLVTFESQAYWSMLVGRGWAVLALNAVGSSTYSREFLERLRGRWGELDLPQQLAAVDQLQAEGLADDRIAVAGKSYGGYMASWAIGQTDRFRAAVVMAPVTNIETHYGTSDGGYYADPYSMRGNGEAQRQLMRQLSPMNYATRVRTPTLILQGEKDERCPKCQAEELFVNIMANSDTPAELVIYPGGSHMFTSKGQPSHRKDIFTRIVDWLERWASTSERSGTEHPPKERREEAIA